MLVAHKDAFDTGAVVEREEIFDRAVDFGDELFLDLRKRVNRFGLKLFTQGLGEVGHFRYRGAKRKPGCDLLGSEGGLADRLYELCKLGKIEGIKIGFIV